ncbi:MAG: ArsR/SmtB family transcription factor [bacterium]
MDELVGLTKGLAHKTRLRILNLLRRQALCVCELRNILNLNQSNASQHLNKLKRAGLIEGEKRAQWKYYSLKEEILTRYSFLNLMLEEDFTGCYLLRKDINRLERYNKSDLDCKTLDEADIFEENRAE